MEPARRGHYLGTEIGERWWRRYGHGFFASGLGEYRIGPETLSFRRYLTRQPLEIPLADVVDVKQGTWHAGHWAGGAPVVKIVWEREGRLLSSGFVFARDVRETEAIVRTLRARLPG